MKESCDVIDDIENLRAVFAKLVAYRDKEDKPLTQQAMADQLNADGVLSLSGKSWSKYSVRRILKKFDFQDSASITSGGRVKAKKEAISKQSMKEPAEEGLKETAPLRQWSYYESIRAVVEELLQKPYTNESIARELNKKSIATTTGAPWDSTSAARAVKALGSKATPSQVSDDEIRDRIRKGWYDTEWERFVAVPVKKKKKDKIKKESGYETKQKKKKKKKDKK